MITILTIWFLLGFIGAILLYYSFIKQCIIVDRELPPSDLLVQVKRVGMLITLLGLFGLAAVFISLIICKVRLSEMRLYYKIPKQYKNKNNEIN